jgi:phytoene/squalene synthetase
LYSPTDERAVIDALLGIESEVATSLNAGVDHRVAHVRLQWWRDECERAAKGQGVHPLTQTLAREFATLGETSAHATPPASTPAAPEATSPMPTASTPALAGVAAFVDTAVWDLASATFETRQELTAYCDRWSSAMFLTAVSHATGAAGATWLTVGAAIREIDMLANLAVEARAGRVRVPLDELETSGVDAEGLAKNPWPAKLARVLASRHEALRAELERGVATVQGTAQPAVRGLLVWAALAWRQSKRAQLALPNQLQPGRFDTLGDAWVAWRAAQRAVRGRFTLP